MRVIAITGGIGTGKSTAVQMLAAQLGCPSCSCDAVVHALLRTPELLTEIAQRFPGVVTPEGEVDRRRLGDLVFHSEAERRVLESLLHPRVLERVETWIEEHQNGTTFGLVEVPLLYEVDFPIKRDVDIVVACSERTQILRLALRERSSAQAGSRIGAQLPLSEKMLRADVVIWNEGSFGTLTRLVALAACGIHQKLH
jgi:dephospho-CoA kinase